MAPIEFAEHRELVLPEWLDACGVLSPAYAVVAFDRAIDRFYDGLGLGSAYLKATGCSTFTVETHTLLEQPVPGGETVVVRTRLLDADAKRLHVAQEMFLPGAPARVAAMEQLALHVDLSQRRSAPFPAERAARVRAVLGAQADAPRPAGIGLQVELRSR